MINKEFCQPIRPQERLIEVDILRGFAVFGMIVWNFNSRSIGKYSDLGFFNSTINIILSLLNFENVIHLLFSFLFGWGLGMQMQSNNNNIIKIHFRKLLILYAFGLIHSIFWYRADIIHIYAFFGVFVCLFIKKRITNKALLIYALFFMGLPVFGIVIIGRFTSPELYYGFGIFQSLRAEVITSLLYRDMVLMRADEFIRAYFHFHTYFRNMDIFGSILLGLYIFRRGVLQNIQKNIQFLHKTLWISLIVYFLCIGWLYFLRDFSLNELDNSNWLYIVYILISLGGHPDGTGMLIDAYSKQILTVFYLSLIVLLLHNNKFKIWFIFLFQKVGHMAISNYLLHSLIGTTLFYGYGLGLYGKLGWGLGGILVILVFIFQMIISNLWLKNFQYGPIEWLWRSLTYSQLLPFVRNEENRQ